LLFIPSFLNFFPYTTIQVERFDGIYEKYVTAESVEKTFLVRELGA
jgi:hypothetical protein